jgi:hypothetical protein
MTSAARVSSALTATLAMVAKAYIEQGTSTMPILRNDPEEMSAAKGPGSSHTSANASRWLRLPPLSN